MLAYDDPKCTVEWYHHECVGFKRAPQGRWYCSSCRTPLKSYDVIFLLSMKSNSL